MKKVEFIELLRKKLSIIEENELNDILDEYEQHITMKIEERNCTEDEAIADFGDVNQLIAEILQAYHVRTNYDEQQKKEKRMQVAEKSKEYAEKTAGLCSKAVVWIKEHFKKLCSSIKGFFSNIFKKDDYIEENEQKEEIFKKNKLINKQERYEEEKVSFLSKVNRVFNRFMRCCIRFIRWCLRVVCNITAAFITGMVGILSAFNIIALGILLVLMFMGYPIIGITIISIGALMCETAVIAFSFGLIKRKKNRQEVELDEQEV